MQIWRPGADSSGPSQRAEESRPAVPAVGADALRWQFITYPLGAWVIVSNMMLQTIRRTGRATLLASVRQGLFFIPLIFLLPRFLGLMGVEMCQAVADVLSFLLAVPLTYGVLKELRVDKVKVQPVAGG